MAAAEVGQMVTEVGSAKALWQEAEEDQGMPSGVDAWIGKAQSGGALAGMLDRAIDPLKGLLGEDAIVTEALDFEQPAVRAEADFAQLRQVVQSFANGEVVGVVDRRFGAQSALLLVILLDPGVLVIDVEGGCDAVGEDAGAPASGGAAGDPAIKDQLDLIGPAEIEVLADHLFEKQPAVHRAIEHLGQRKLGLKDRNIVAEAGGLIGRGERMGEKAQPLAQQAVDLFGRQAVADLLKPLGSAQLSTPLSRA